MLNVDDFGSWRQFEKTVSEYRGPLDAPRMHLRRMRSAPEIEVRTKNTAQVHGADLKYLGGTTVGRLHSRSLHASIRCSRCGNGSYRDEEGLLICVSCGRPTGGS